MIKIANNLQRMLAKQASGNPQMLYSPELGGFHTPGTYPQSMSPERYQQHQALNYINRFRFDEPEYFNSPEDLAMALNTSGIANIANVQGVTPEQIQASTNRTRNNPINFGSMTPADYNYDLGRGLAVEAYMSPERQPNQPAVMPFETFYDTRLRPLYRPQNQYEKLQRRMAEDRASPNKGGVPGRYLTAAYDVTPDNPMGITALNPTSDAQVANLASQKVEDYIKSVPRKFR